MWWKIGVRSLKKVGRNSEQGICPISRVIMNSKGYEGNDCGLLEILCRHFLEGSGENHEDLNFGRC